MRDWLKVYGNRRVLSLLGLGFSSGLPLALIGTTLQAWMTYRTCGPARHRHLLSGGIALHLEGPLGPDHGPFHSPLDGTPPRAGSLSPNSFSLLSILAMGLTSPSTMPWVVASLALVIAFCSASQDIVVDAYRADVLHEQELGAGAATTVVGYRVALLVSGAFALILSDYLPWRMVYLIMGALMLANILFTFLAPEPSERVIPPKTLKDAVWEPLISYFRRSGAVEMLVFIMVYKLSDAIAGAMTTPFLLDMGFSRTDVGTVNKAFGLLSTILGTLAGGSIIAKIGINRSLWIFAFLQAFPHLAFTVLALIGKNYAAMVAAIGLENICGGMGTAAFVAFMMRLCDKRFTATQYALLTSFMAVTRVIAGVPTGFMVASMGWPVFFAVSILGALPGILLLPRFAPWKAERRGVISDE